MEGHHKVPDCKGRWINVGTFADPFKQVCGDCRAYRQKPVEEEDRPMELASSTQRHMEALARLKNDLENADPVHQDEEGFWFWDETWVDRYGPYETEAVARDRLSEYVCYMSTQRTERSSANRLGYIALGFVFIALIISVGYAVYIS